MKFSKSALNVLNHRELTPLERRSMKKIAKRMALYLGKKEINGKIAGWAIFTVGLSGIPLAFSNLRRILSSKIPWAEKYLKEMQKPELPDNLTIGAKKALYFLMALKMYKRELTEKEYHFFLDIAEILRQHYGRDKITVKEISASETASCLVLLP